MGFLIILKSNLRRMIRNRTNMLAGFIIPCVVVVGLGFVFSKITAGGDIENAVVNSDKGSYGSELIKELKNNTNIKIYDKEEATEKLKKKNLSVFYQIPEDFSEKIAKGEKPQINSFKLESGINVGNFQLNANSIINNMVLRNEFKNNNKDVSLDKLKYQDSKIEVVGRDKSQLGDTIILNMLISFVLFGAIGITMELHRLGEQNIIRRSFTTANKPSVIIGAILLGLFVISGVSYCIVYILSGLVNSPSLLSRTPVALLNILCLTLVSLSAGVFTTRVIKNESLIPIILQIAISVTCFFGGSFMPIEFLPKAVTMFSKFTPQYWALQSINNQKPELAIIVVLFALVLFTAGTFKTKSIA